MMNRDARVWSPDGLDSFADAMWRASIDLMQKRARDILTLVCRADYDRVLASLAESVSHTVWQTTTRECCLLMI